MSNLTRSIARESGILLAVLAAAGAVAFMVVYVIQKYDEFGQAVMWTH